MTVNQMTRKRMTDWILVTLREAAWAPLGVIGLYLLGLLFGVYDRFPPLDIPTHFLGGVAITYLYRVAIKGSRQLVGEIPFPIQVLFAFTCTGTTIILWEFAENIIDFFFHTEMVRGLEDTIMDML